MHAVPKRMSCMALRLSEAVHVHERRKLERRSYTGSRSPDAARYPDIRIFMPHVRPVPRSLESLPRWNALYCCYCYFIIGAGRGQDWLQVRTRGRALVWMITSRARREWAT